jgi:peptidoglycan-associated lipoprotein
VTYRPTAFVFVAIAAVAAQGCATRGFVREQIAAQAVTTRTDVAAARDSAVMAAEASRETADRALAQRLNSRVDSVAAQVAALRNDLDGLRRDFGAQISMMKDSMKFAMPVHFSFDDATVRQQDQAAIARFAAIAKAYYPDARVTIEGFADPAGSAAYNRDLSMRRAESVRTALVSQGMMDGNLTAIGLGETRLVTPRAMRDDPGAELNRRVVFVIETAGSAVTAAMMQDDGQPLTPGTT